MTTIDTGERAAPTEAAAPTAAADGAPSPAAGPEGRLAPPARFGWWLLGLTLVGIAVRVVYLLAWRHPTDPTGDSWALHHGANLLAEGEGYADPFRTLLYGTRAPGLDLPPGPVTLLGAAAWLGLRSFLAHQVVASVLGALVVPAVGLAGRRLAGARAGLAAAGLAALSPALVPLGPLLEADALLAPSAALAVWAATRWWDRPSAGAAALFGAAVGAAGLVRPEALVIGPAVALPLVWWRRRRPAGLAELAAAGAAAALVVAPWAAWSWATAERPRPLPVPVERALAAGACDATFRGDLVGGASPGCVTPSDALVGEDASVPAADDAARARRYLADDTRRIPYVVTARVGRTLGVYAAHEQVELDAADGAPERQVAMAGLFTWFAVAAAGAVGLVGLRHAGRPLVPVVGVVAGVVVAAAVLHGGSAVRLPAEVALLVPAGVTVEAGAAALARRWRARRAPAAPVPADGTLPDPDGQGGGQGDDGLAVDGRAPAGDGQATGGQQLDGAARAASPPGTAGPAGGAPAEATRRDPPGGLGSSGGQFAGFDGLRAIAALGVLLCHVGLQSGYVARERGVGEWISRADAGVALFFVLSGFLLYRPFVAARMDGRSGPRTASYLRKRFLRIFPAYWLALTVLVVVIDTRARNDIRGWGDVVMYYGLLQSYSESTALGGLQQAWTLVNEVAFYLLLPLWAAGAALLARRLPPRTAVRAELAVLAAGAAGALAFRWWLHGFQPNDPSLGEFDPRFHWLVANFHLFVPGMALAVALEWSRRRSRPLALLELVRRHPLVCWAGALACFWAVSTQLDLGIQVGASSRGQGIAKELLYAGFGFALFVPVALAGARLPRSLRWLGSRVMVALGVLSYGIYLWHEGVTDLYRDVRNLPVLTGPFVGTLVTTLVLSVSAAAASYLLLERPALRLKDRGHRPLASWRPTGLPAGTGRPVPEPVEVPSA